MAIRHFEPEIKDLQEEPKIEHPIARAIQGQASKYQQTIKGMANLAPVIAQAG